MQLPLQEIVSLPSRRNTLHNRGMAFFADNSSHRVNSLCIGAGVVLGLFVYLMVATTQSATATTAVAPTTATSATTIQSEDSLLFSTSPSAPASVATQSAGFNFEKAELQDDIAEVKRTLNGQLAEYRQLDQEFTILKGQFFKLNTLSSLEAAVQATRVVQEKRNQVLGTYLALLKLEISSTAGMKPEYAEYSLQEIASLEQALLRHTDQVRLSLDRTASNKSSADFVPIALRVQNTIAFSRASLQLARYQALFDSTVTVLEAIYNSKDATAESKQPPILVTPQDQRAFEQILEVMIELEDSLNVADAQVKKVVDSAGTESGNIDIETSISNAYGNFSQVFSFLDELLGSF